MTYTLPPISITTSTSTDTNDSLTEALTHLFEYSTPLHALILSHLPKTFTDWNDFINFTYTLLNSLLPSHDNDSTLLQILSAHPRLGAGANATLSTHSCAEQSSLLNVNANGGDDDTNAVDLQKWNAVYEDAFPGMRYVVFVNNRSKTQIIQNLRQRVKRADRAAEMRDAISAMRDIAKDRASKLQR